ncbi:MAG: hypothetical protein IKC69_02785 [Clostridia bacterium]|nr:hypothetical protein [Clostridia bacterium]
MKRIVAFLFTLLTLLPLFSCQNTEAPAATERKAAGEIRNPITSPSIVNPEEWKKTTETEEEIAPPVTVLEPLTPDRIHSIPVADASMSTEELRRICVEFFALEVSFTWTPKSTAKYVVQKFLHPVTYQKGGLYAGIPYVLIGSGNLYRTMDYYDEATGVYDVSGLAHNQNLVGNACSGSAGYAWGRVVNSAMIAYTESHTPKNGFIPLGDYVSNPFIYAFGVTAPESNPGAIDTDDIIAQNDPQTMYESYALLLPADGIVNPGHVRMAKEAAVVVRNADDTIDPEESYCIFIEQGCYCDGPHHTRTQADGTVYQIQGNDNYKASFAQLLKDHYLPFTFAEFLGTDPVEPGEVTLEIGGAVIGRDETDLRMSTLTKGNVTSNYVITDAYCVIRDENGTELVRYAHRQIKHYLREFPMVALIPQAVIKQYGNKGYRIELSAQITTGERIVFYEGKAIE